MKKFVFISVLIFYIILTSMPVFSEDRIGKINIGLLTALHPNMAFFDFQRMGFSKRIVNNKYEWEPEVTEVKDEEKENRILEQKKQRKDYLQEQIRLAYLKKSEIFSNVGTTYVSQMPEKEKKEYDIIEENLSNLIKEEALLDYSIRNPEHTLPNETQKLLGVIEEDVVNAVKEAAEELNCNVVLNSTILSSYGYPVEYHKSPDYYNGAVGINQSIYYAIMSKDINGRYDEDWQKTKIIEWLAMISRPSVQDELPVKPYPIVMKGGVDLLEKSLLKIYTKYNIKPQVYSAVIKVLKERGMIDESK